MPKLIHNLRERVLASAREILASDGYRALSMRALARRCDVAPGTLYNYFASKEELVATIMLEDWQDALSRMDEVARGSASLTEGLVGLCRALDAFTGSYRGLWEQYDGASATSYVTRYHRTLREQIAGPVRTVVGGAGREDLAPLADVLAEALLACSVNADLGPDHMAMLASALDAARPKKED